VIGKNRRRVKNRLDLLPGKRNFLLSATIRSRDISESCERVAEITNFVFDSESNIPIF